MASMVTTADLNGFDGPDNLAAYVYAVLRQDIATRHDGFDDLTAWDPVDVDDGSDQRLHGEPPSDGKNA